MNVTQQLSDLHAMVTDIENDRDAANIMGLVWFAKETQRRQTTLVLDSYQTNMHHKMCDKYGVK